jgi:DNA-binding transcriptional MocR family regulator
MLPDGIDEEVTIAAATGRGVGVEGLAGCSSGSATAATPGLILGYGNLPEHAIAHGVRLLAGV